MFGIKKEDKAFAPLMGIVTLLIGIIVVIAIGSVILTSINTSTYNASSSFNIDNLGSQWVMLVGLVLIAVLALIGFFIIRMFGSGGE